MAVTPSGGQTGRAGVAPGLAVSPQSNHNRLAYQSSGPGTGSGPVTSAGLMVARSFFVHRRITRDHTCTAPGRSGALCGQVGEHGQWGNETSALGATGR